MKGGPSVFFMGGSDFVERNVAGLSPDVAMIAMQASDATHAYAERIVTALGRPTPRRPGGVAAYQNCSVLA